MENHRIPIEVQVLVKANGSIVPRAVIVQEKTFPITKILSAAQRYPAGVPCISPIEFSVIIEGREKKIYYEKASGRWFSVGQKAQIRME